MKRTLLTVLVALFAGISLCMAQDDNRQHGPRGQRMDPKERTEQLIRELELTETQAAQFRVVMEEQQKQMQAQMEANRGQLQEGQRPTEEQMKQMRARMQEQQAAINTVLQLILTEEQFQKYRQLTERRGPRGGQGGPRDGQGRRDRDL